MVVVGNWLICLPLLFRSCVSRTFHLKILIELSPVHQLGQDFLVLQEYTYLHPPLTNMGFSEQQLIYSAIRKKRFTQHWDLLRKVY